MNKLQYILLSILLSGLLSGCIDEYTPKDVEEMSGLLVVEGMITNDTTIIKLSKSVGILEDISELTILYNADVLVETDNGQTFPATSVSQNGEYIIPIGDLIPGTQYKLKIKAEGNEYESSPLTPVLTPPIDSIYAYKERDGEPIYVTVSTHKEGSETGYYLWSYNEIWEINARLNAELLHTTEPIHPDYEGDIFFAGERGGYIVYYDNIDGPYFNEGLNCWGYGRSNSLLLGSSDKLSENRIINLKLSQYEPSDYRFSSLYYIKLKQNTLRKETYDYLSNLQKNAESTGDIFGPIPSEMKGNIVCTTDPSIHVIGYIDVSITSSMEKFIPRSGSLYEAPYMDCKEIGEWEDGYAPLYYQERVGIFYAWKECLDCRLSRNATKNRPPFWPR